MFHNHNAKRIQKEQCLRPWTTYCWHILTYFVVMEWDVSCQGWLWSHQTLTSTYVLVQLVFPASFPVFKHVWDPVLALRTVNIQTNKMQQLNLKNPILQTSSSRDDMRWQHPTCRSLHVCQIFTHTISKAPWEIGYPEMVPKLLGSYPVESKGQKMESVPGMGGTRWAPSPVISRGP